MGVCPPCSVSLTSLTFIRKHAHGDCVHRAAATFTPLLPKLPHFRPAICPSFRGRCLHFLLPVTPSCDLPELCFQPPTLHRAATRSLKCMEPSRGAHHCPHHGPQRWLCVLRRQSRRGRQPVPAPGSCPHTLPSSL